MMRRTLHIIRRLHKNVRGVAFIEFAFAAPIFLTLLMAGLETANLALAYMRVSQMASTVADNAGRVRGGIDEANIHEVYAGASVVGANLDFENNGRMVLSALEENGQTGRRKGQMIRWQRCWGEMDVEPAYGVEGDGTENNSLSDGLGAGGNRIIAGTGRIVMFVEVTYKYQPLIGTGFFDPPTIRFETAYNVRERQNNVLTNTQRLAEMDCD